MATKVQLTVLLIIPFIQCCNHNKSSNIPARYYHKDASYRLNIECTADTLRFPLGEDIFNTIESFNIFSQNDKRYISFYEGTSETINIYHFDSGRLTKQIHIKSTIPEKKFSKTSVFTKTMDSIFIVNNNNIYIIDTSCNIKHSFTLQELDAHAMILFENSLLPAFQGSKIITGRHARSLGAYLGTLQMWKMIYSFDLKTGKMEEFYSLPDTYLNNLFGYNFLDYSFCYNDKKRFVLSFPADTNIYETDLKKYHVAFYGQSRYQTSPIPPVPKKELLTNMEVRLKSYLVRDSYGEIYFDPIKKRYLRVAKSGLTESEYSEKIRSKKQRLIILDEYLTIIGESAIDQNVSLSSIVITMNGEIYARVNRQDEYAVNFVRLEYSEESVRNTTHLTKKY
nr:DUF4221 family protein [Chitinophaga sp. XS-30]